MTRKARARAAGVGGHSIRRSDLKPSEPTAAEILRSAEKDAKTYKVALGITPEQEAMLARMQARRKKLTG